MSLFLPLYYDEGSQLARLAKTEGEIFFFFRVPTCNNFPTCVRGADGRGKLSLILTSGKGG